ncbi:hypothetical protein DOY81_006715, partial [Sarcophaga bullata]
GTQLISCSLLFTFVLFTLILFFLYNSFTIVLQSLLIAFDFPFYMFCFFFKLKGAGKEVLKLKGDGWRGNNVKCISDEQALEELQYLLHDHALNWWLRRKGNTNTWSEALVLLQNQFSKRRPAHVVYRDILNHSYDHYASKADFVDDQMELFSELAQAEMKEENKLDLIYALLPSDILNKVTNVKTHVVKGLKEQLSLIQLNEDNKQSNEKLARNENCILQADVNKSVYNEETETSTIREPITNSTITEDNSPNTQNSDGYSVLKVRRTEDLMPSDVKNEQKILSNEGHTPPDENNEQAIISNDDDLMPLEVKKEQESVASDINSDKTNDNFHIDSDIVKQINNIIDKSEMNTDALSDNHIQTVSPQPTNGASSLELLEFHTEATIHPETICLKSPPQQQSEKIANPTKKQRMRCSYCRLRSHTIQTCLKKARHLKLFPENHFQRKPPDNPAVCTKTIAANKSSIESSTEVSLKSEISPVTSSLVTTIPLTSTAMSTADVNNTASVVVNNPIEKITNPSLTTKLIAPINGPMPSKLLAAKLRNTTTPSAKCHQCGNVGFYKSICPNCSPIYNNNSNNMQYSK